MRRFAPLAVIVVLFSTLISSAQNAQLSLYGAIFSSRQNVSVGFWAPPSGVQFRLERLLEPERVLSELKDPHRPELKEEPRVRLVRTFQRRKGTNGYDQLFLGKLPQGVYLLRANAIGMSAATLVVVSDLSLVVKRGPREALVYVADRLSGMPRAARITVLENGPRSSGTASADGVLRVDLAKANLSAPTFLARFGDAVALSSSSWNEWALPSIRGYIYSDRPVYRPGQRVEFKGVARNAKTLQPLQNVQLSAIVRNADGDEMYQTSVKTNDFGSFSTGFDLPVGARLGYYAVVATRSSQSGHEEEISGSFYVEEYVKPEYAVTVTPAKARAVQGERVSVRVSAAYLFGGVVSGARVTYSITKARYYPPFFYDDGEEVVDDERDYGSNLVIREEARLDAKGQLEITLPLAREEEGVPTSYRIEAEVEDEARHTVSGRSRVVAFPSMVNVDVSTTDYVVAPGEMVRASIKTTDLYEKALSASTELEFVRSEWMLNRLGQYEERQTVLERKVVRTDAAGQATVSFRSRNGGGYLIRATARDAAKRPAKSETFVWVVGSGDNWYWNYRSIEVKLDKNRYAVGETATALIGSPKPGTPMLVTIEAEGIMRAEVVRSRSAAIRYAFKVTPEMSGDVFLTATLLSDDNFYTQETRVRVPNTSGALSVSIKPNKARFAPGEQGKLELSVVDAEGKPAAAELGFSVVDEAIYLIRPDTSVPIYKVMFSPRDNAVATESSFGFSFESVTALARPRAEMDSPAFAQGKGGGPTSPEGEPPREDFRDTILWVPHLVTDASGRVSVEVKFPDNLTTWRATARAIGRTPTAGESTASMVTTKDLIARLSLPRFLVHGDQVSLSAIVNNTTTQSQRGTLSLELSGLAADAKSLSNAVTVPPAARTNLNALVQATTVGTASVTARIQTAGPTDAIRLPLEVRARGFRDTVTWVGGTGEEARSFTIPNDAILQTARLRVSATSSLVSSVAPALEYLAGYPYGCTEQTMSRFYPALLAKDLPNLPFTAAQLDNFVASGIARLERFQHEDGGWGFWETDESTLEMTAYVVHGLLRAKGLGVKLSPDVLESAVNYLRSAVRDVDASMNERARAYRVLVEAARSDLEGMRAFSRRSELEPYALAQLTVAFARLGRMDETRDLADRLLAKRIERTDAVYWPASEGYAWSDNDISVTASAYEAIARLQANHPLLAKIESWLLRARRGPRWISTQDTATVIEAAMVRAAAIGPQSVNVRVELNADASVLSDDAAKFEAVAFKVRSGSLKVTGPSGFVYSAELSFDREPERLSGESRGLSISRRYERLVPRWNDGEKRYTFVAKPLLRGVMFEPLTVGELVLVTLTVESKDDVRYALVSDPIPAGMQALDERSLAIAGLEESEDLDVWDAWYSGRELRDDRVDLYAYALDGRQTMRYVLRAQTPGTFTALPTQAFLMYDPEVRGRGAAATLTVRDRGQ